MEKVLGKHFTQEAINEANKVEPLQNWLYNLKQENIEDVSQKILNSVFIQKDNMYSLIDNIVTFVCIRLNCANMYAQLVSKLSIIDGFYEELLPFLLKRAKLVEVNRIYKQTKYAPKIFMFLRHLMLCNVYTVERLWDAFNESRNRLCNMIYYIPEFQKFDPKILDTAIGSACSHQKSLINVWYEKYTDQWDILLKEYELPGTLERAIIDDDIELFSVITSDPDFNWAKVKCDVSPISPTNLDDVYIISSLQYVADLSRFAAAHGSVKCFKFCILNKAPYNVKKIAGDAIEGGSLEIVRILEQEGVSFENAASFAAEYFRNDILDWIFEQNPTNNRMAKKMANNALKGAGLSNNIYGLFKLLSFNAKLSYKGNNRSIFHSAAESGHLDMMKLILSSSSARPSVTDYFKMTPLHYAAQRGFPEMCKLLVDHDADINAMIGDHRTPLHFAVDSGDLETVKILGEQKGCIIDKAEWYESGYTPFLTAVRNNSLEIAKYLISKGADHKISGWYGQNAIFLAAEAQSMEMLEYVLSLKPRPKIKNGKFFEGSPLMVAITTGNRPMFQRLKKEGLKLRKGTPIQDLSYPIIRSADLKICDVHEALKMINEEFGYQPKDFAGKIEFRNEAEHPYEAVFKEYGLE